MVFTWIGAAGWTGGELTKALWSEPEIGLLRTECTAGCEMEWCRPMIGRHIVVAVQFPSGDHGSAIPDLKRNVNAGESIEDGRIVKGFCPDCMAPSGALTLCFVLNL